MTQPELATALLAEAAKKSDLLWVSVGDSPATALWHIWRDDAVLLVTGGLEQPDPGLVDGTTVTVVLRSRDKGSRLLTVEATAERVDPASPDWPDLAEALHAKRLNSPDGDAAVERWRSGSTVWRLVPTGRVIEEPGAMSDSHHRAEAVATPATTPTRQPFHLGRATRVRR